MLVVGPLASCTPDDRGRPLGAEPERRVGGVAPMPDLDETAAIRAEVGQTIYVPAYSRVPTSDGARHEALMVRDFADVPRDAERVVFFPRAAGG